MDPGSPDTVLSAIRNAFHWYSLWPHTRDSQWKGFIELNLQPEGEDDAWRSLEELSA